MIRVVAAVLVVLPLAVSAEEPAPSDSPPQATAVLPPPAAIPVTVKPPERSGVYMGFGLGVSDLGQVGNGGPAYRIRLGVARSPRLLFGFEGAHTTDGEWTLNAYDVGATFFPWRKYFFVRAAFGLSSSARGSAPTQQGVNALLGLGVAIGAVKGFNVTLNLETTSHRLTGGAYDESVGNPSAWLGLEWL